MSIALRLGGSDTVHTCLMVYRALTRTLVRQVYVPASEALNLRLIIYNVGNNKAEKYKVKRLPVKCKCSFVPFLSDEMKAISGTICLIGHKAKKRKKTISCEEARLLSCSRELRRLLELQKLISTIRIRHFPVSTWRP
jgi:hypothetical protein